MKFLSGCSGSRGRLFPQVHTEGTEINPTQRPQRKWARFIHLLLRVFAPLPFLRALRVEAFCERDLSGTLRQTGQRAPPSPGTERRACGKHKGRGRLNGEATIVCRSTNRAVGLSSPDAPLFGASLPASKRLVRLFPSPRKSFAGSEELLYELNWARRVATNSSSEAQS